MKHRTIMVLALISVVAFTASAQMRGGMMHMHGDTGRGPAWGTEEAAEVDLSGTLRLAVNQLPVLVADGEELTLQIPPVLAAEIQVRDGQAVQVSGYRFQRPSRDLLGPVSVVMVHAIEVDGTRYVMPAMMGSRGMGRPDAGRMGESMPHGRHRGR
jgi:hypothetical protein